jgi:hypothetical protein
MGRDSGRRTRSREAALGFVRRVCSRHLGTSRRDVRRARCQLTTTKPASASSVPASLMSSAKPKGASGRVTSDGALKPPNTAPRANSEARGSSRELGRVEARGIEVLESGETDTTSLTGRTARHLSGFDKDPKVLSVTMSRVGPIGQRLQCWRWWRTSDARVRRNATSRRARDSAAICRLERRCSMVERSSHPGRSCAGRAPDAAHGCAARLRPARARTG